MPGRAGVCRRGGGLGACPGRGLAGQVARLGSDPVLLAKLKEAATGTDLIKDWDAFKLMGALNAHLRNFPVAVLQAVRVEESFHARFSAIERRYLFRLIARRAPATLDKGKVWRVMMPLDVEAMQAGAAYLLGKHDFTTFRCAISCP